MPNVVVTRIPATVSFLEFHARFLETDTPVIVQNVPIAPSLRARLSVPSYIDDVQAGLAASDAQRKAETLLDVIPEAFANDAPVREGLAVISRFVPHKGVNFRRSHIRLWGSKQGEVTSWHYDGNLLHVLNLQVVGRKYWQLVSPRTPMPTLPFMHYFTQGASPLNQRQRNELEWAEFETQPGDLLFIPRLWAHYVTSLEAWNANLSVVFTSVSEPVSAMAEREHRRLVGASAIKATPLRKMLPLADRETDYGGDKDYFLAKSRRAVGRFPVLRSLAHELRGVPLALFLRRYKRALGIDHRF